MTTEVLGRSQSSVCDGVTTAFPVDFSFKANSDLKVYLIDAADEPNGVGTLLIEGADYTIAGVGATATAEVNTAVAYPVGKFIRRWRVTERDQEASYVPNDGFPAKSHETQLDRLSRITEEHDNDIACTVRAPAGEGTLIAIPPAAVRRGKLLAFTNDVNADPALADLALISGLFFSMLAPGFGIAITQNVDGIITITNTVSEVGGGAIDAVLLSGDQFDGESGPGGSTAEDIRDLMGGVIQGVGCVVTPDDPGDHIIIDLTQEATAEVIRDRIGATLAQGFAVLISVNDPGNSVTIAVDVEAIQDMIAGFLASAAGIVLTYNDAGNVETIATEIDGTYKGIVPTIRNAAFNFDNAMNGRATDWTGGAANATIRLQANYALDVGWCHRLRNSSVAPLTIHRETAGVSLHQPPGVASGDVVIAPGSTAFLERWAADDFTIEVNG